MKYLRVIEFSDHMTNNEELCNEFLSTTGENVHKVQVFYNTILGGTVYVVIYWDYAKKTKKADYVI